MGEEEMDEKNREREGKFIRNQIGSDHGSINQQKTIYKKILYNVALSVIYCIVPQKYNGVGYAYSIYKLDQRNVYGKI